MSPICVANNDGASMKQPRTVSPSSSAMNSDTDELYAKKSTRKSALKVTKDGHTDGARGSAISASFGDSENEIIEVRARGHHRRLAKKSEHKGISGEVCGSASSCRILRNPALGSVPAGALLGALPLGEDQRVRG